MQTKNTNQMACCGRIPSNPSLAYPYVAFQLENPGMYQKSTGFVRGTLFPGLDLPFMGMINQNEFPLTPLTELQILAFAIQELALYLDTHRDDKDALEIYQGYQKMYNDGVKIYEKEYGPLNHLATSDGPYRWLDDPWPWEYCKNCEV